MERVFHIRPMFVVPLLAIVAHSTKASLFAEQQASPRSERNRLALLLWGSGRLEKGEEDNEHSDPTHCESEGADVGDTQNVYDRVYQAGPEEDACPCGCVDVC